MKIRYHHPMFYSEAYKGYDDVCKEFIDKVKGPDIEVEHTWSKRGTQIVQYQSADLLNTIETVEFVLDAQDKGFDAVIIGCSLDIGLKQAREVANIPVVSSMEASMFASCFMGKKFSIISFGERARVRQEQLIDEYGLRARATSVKSFEMTLAELGKALTSEAGRQGLRKIFMDEARKVVTEEKAEVIVPGCGILAALCMMEGIVRVDGMEDVPIIDMFVPALKIAEIFVNMKNSIGIDVVSRRGIYQSPSGDAIKQLREIYKK